MWRYKGGGIITVGDGGLSHGFLMAYSGLGGAVIYDDSEEGSGHHWCSSGLLVVLSATSWKDLSSLFVLHIRRQSYKWLFWTCSYMAPY